MASKVQRMQHLTIALCEGFVDMLWNQTYSRQKNNKTFSKMRNEIKDKCNLIRIFIKKEGGEINAKDVAKIKEAIDTVKEKYLIDGKGFTAMIAVSMMVDMVIYQLRFVKEQKEKLFQDLLYKINYLVRYFDKDRTWEDTNERCLKATEELRQIMGVQ